MNLWRMPAEGGTEEQVTQHGGMYPVESFDGQYIYFSKSGTDATIWRVPSAGGEEEQVLGVPVPADNSHWALTRDGIYIVNQNGDLLFYAFANQRTVRIEHHAGFLTNWSMTLSPDGRELVWAQVDSRNEDLLMVDNFE